MREKIPPDLVDRMMVKCARRCCICRRYRPTKLQVHHIEERAQGGGNDEGNLIVVCLSCHSDVHTKVPFARRFSVNELKGHRDALVRAVEDGKLPTSDTDDADEVMLRLVQSMTTPPKMEIGMLPEAVEILLRAVNTDGEQQGSVLLSEHFEGMSINAGSGTFGFGRDDKRAQARYKRALKQLVATGLLEAISADVFEVTDEGFLAADELMVTQGEC